MSDPKIVPTKDHEDTTCASDEFEEWSSETSSNVNPNNTISRIPIASPVECAIPMYNRHNNDLSMERMAVPAMYNHNKVNKVNHNHNQVNQNNDQNNDQNNQSNSNNQNQDITEQIVNDWDKNSYNTIVRWRDDISKSSFIYGQLLDRNEFKVRIVLIFTLILSTFMTILSGISVALSSLDIDMKWVIFSFNIITLISAGAVTTMNGIIKIIGWDTAIKELTKTIEKLDNQWFVFETELNIPAEQRQNAKDFIKRADGDYMHLMQTCPHVSIDDYVEANISYQERLAENLIWQRKFNKQNNLKIEQN